MGDIRVGTASWTDRALTETGWYPPEVRTPAQRLACYAERFPLVEVDSTYYHPPAERTAQLWAERTPPDFTFNIKAFSLLTHHPTPPSALPKDLRPAAEAAARGRRNLYLRDAGPELADEMWQRFTSALAPLHEAGRLGAVLLQFPPWFTIGRESKRYLLECRDRCAPYRVCVEFRNAGWMAGENRHETFAFLVDHDLPYVCVDMPQGHPSSIPPLAVATSDLAVVRFHGRSDHWNSRDIELRFGHRYSIDELREWVPRIEHLAEQADTTHVLMNNCRRDDAQVNARQLADLLGLPPGPG
jgi:uncharacterized protein YecE (DUF72 family)